MIDAFVGGLEMIFQLKPFLFLVIGATIGFWVGILPGLGGAPTLALMLPFVYKMTPAEAFPFLLECTLSVQRQGISRRSSSASRERPHPWPSSRMVSP